MKFSIYDDNLLNPFNKVRFHYGFTLFPEDFHLPTRSLSSEVKLVPNEKMVGFVDDFVEPSDIHVKATEGMEKYMGHVSFNDIDEEMDDDDDSLDDDSLDDSIASLSVSSDNEDRGVPESVVRVRPPPSEAPFSVITGHTALLERFAEGKETEEDQQEIEDAGITREALNNYSKFRPDFKALIQERKRSKRSDHNVSETIDQMLYDEPMPVAELEILMKSNSMLVNHYIYERLRRLDDSKFQPQYSPHDLRNDIDPTSVRKHRFRIKKDWPQVKKGYERYLEVYHDETGNEKFNWI